jgi:hypothetical protein
MPAEESWFPPLGIPFVGGAKEGGVQRGEPAAGGGAAGRFPREGTEGAIQTASASELPRECGGSRKGSARANGSERGMPATSGSEELSYWSLQGLHNQMRDQAKVARVGCRHGVAQFQRRDADQQICQRDTCASCLELSIDLSGAESDRHCHRMYRHSGQQIVQKLPPVCQPLRCVGASDAMSQLQHRNYRDGNLRIVHGETDGFQHLVSRLPTPFRGNHYGGIEYQSHSGGSNGSR